MILGIGSWTYGWQAGIPGQSPPHPLGALSLLTKAADLGVRRVQIADNLPLHGLDQNQTQALQLKATQLGIAIEVGARGLTPRNLQTYLPIATQFNSPILRIVIDDEGYEPDEDTIVSLIKDALPELKTRDIVLAVENHDRFTARTFARIVDRVGSDRVGICLDTANSFGAAEGLETVLDALLPLTVNLHIKDFVVRRVPHNMGFIIEGAPAGQGMLPIPNLVEALSSKGRCASAILEQWTPPGPNLAGTIRKEEDWARQSVTYLRSLLPE